MINFNEGKTFFAQICFHLQQSAEKYLKAYIVAYELEFRKIHELPLLLKICMSSEPAFALLREDCEYLTTYYVETRYPVHWPTRFSREDTGRAIQAASRIRDFVITKLTPWQS
jgi:HEPN domain-containing protein